MKDCRRLVGDYLGDCQRLVGDWEIIWKIVGFVGDLFEIVG